MYVLRIVGFLVISLRPRRSSKLSKTMVILLDLICIILNITNRFQQSSREGQQPTREKCSFIAQIEPALPWFLHSVMPALIVCLVNDGIIPYRRQKR